MSQIKKTKSIQPWEDLRQGHWVEQLYKNFDAGTCLLRTRSIKKASGAGTQGTRRGKAGCMQGGGTGPWRPDCSVRSMTCVIKVLMQTCLFDYCE